MNAPTDWASAVAILAAGLVLGVLFVVFFTRRKSSPAVTADTALNDLHAKRDALLQQLRDPALDPDERTRLELETAHVLREIDAKGQTTAPASSAAHRAEPVAMNPTVKGFLWGAGSVGALAVLFYLVMQQSTPREEGGSVTGGIGSPQAQQQGGAPDPAVMQLEAAVQRDPNNLQLRNDLAQAYLERENLMGVYQQTQFVLEKAPNDARALTFQGLVRMAMGDANEATQMLQRATESDPKNLDSWVALAWVHAQSGRMADAERMIAEAAKQSPNDSARLQQVFSQMKQQVARSEAPPQAAQGGEMPPGHPPAGEMPPGHPPVDRAAPAAAAPAPSGPSVRVTLDLAAGAKQRSGVLLVIARNPAGGPPAAVKRVMASSFPVTVDLSSADSMMGQPLPPTFRLEARLDSDGDAMTRPATDPSAMQENVKPGAVVSLALK